MEQLRSIWERIQDFLDQLSSSQKWSISLVTIATVIAIGTLLRIQMKSNLVPLGVEMSASQQSEVVDHLEQNSVPHEIRDGNIYVPRERADKLMFDLAGKGLIKSDEELTKWLFQEDFDTRHKREMKWNVTKERRLANMIAKTGPVQSADVRITPGEQHEILKEGEPAKASVRVKLIGKQRLGENEVQSIARVVSGAVEKLSPSDVSIIDNNMNHYRVPDRDDQAYLSADLQEQKKETEKELKEKVLRGVLPWTNRASVAVNVHLNRKDVKRDTLTQEGDPKLKESRSVKETTTRSETPGTKENTEPDPGLQEDGTIPGGRSSPTAGGRTERMEETKTESGKFISSRTKEQIKKPPGDIQLVRASVVIPEKDLYRQVLGRSPEEADRESEEVQEKLRNKLQEYRKNIRTLLETPAKNQEGNPVTEVEISTASFAPPEPPEKPPISDRFLTFLQENLNTIILSVFILVGLVVIYRIIRSTYATDIEEELDRLRSELQEEEEKETSDLEGVPTEARRSSIEEMRRRIEQAVEEDPPVAAGMLRRWLEENQSS